MESRNFAPSRHLLIGSLGLCCITEYRRGGYQGTSSTGMVMIRETRGTLIAMRVLVTDAVLERILYMALDTPLPYIPSTALSQITSLSKRRTWRQPFPFCMLASHCLMDFTSWLQSASYLPVSALHKPERRKARGQCWRHVRSHQCPNHILYTATVQARVRLYISLHHGWSLNDDHASTVAIKKLYEAALFSNISLLCTSKAFARCDLSVDDALAKLEPQGSEERI
ncbi:hypothetical protein ASPBRDRAFT_569868 [Aspergillus brasiliensis CBS 101740]|uniref:Uncharacterized protein n=1 Tax=Aspergillus brasiliensis (strain CBS 101740 / IMI 381727 / IBT 21946) TaxID=767769 RepID=A0A1L9UJ14_ASPBC|nr:hypothetical protein ASPBRDRAFT_569868 [Aspergillus brasiliensis CBS 101740]